MKLRQMQVYALLALKLSAITQLSESFAHSSVSGVSVKHR